jgi:competence protein ComEA
MVLGTVGGLVFPEQSLHPHVSSQNIVAMLDSIGSANAPEAKSRIAVDTATSIPQTLPTAPPQRALVIVNINSASAEQLETIPGIGPATAKAIIEFRRRRRLTSVEDLLDVKGIGKKKLERMRPFITVP